MAQLTPVEYDPFAQIPPPPPSGPVTLTPVDHDPFAGTQGTRPPELRAYQPTWRDAVAAWLMPDERRSPTDSRVRAVEMLTGSRGLGHTGGVNVADMLPPTAAILAGDEGNRAAEAGDGLGVAMAGLAMIPGVQLGKNVARAAAPAVSRAATEAAPAAAEAARAAETAAPRAVEPAAAARPAPAPAPAPAQTAPGEMRITTPGGGMEITARPELVEADQIKLARGELQPRDRTREEYVQAARERAARLDPEQLRPGRVSDSGAPIVAPDGTILSGNGRYLSIGEAYDRPELKAQADAYRASLGPEAANMRRPILVMRAPNMAPEEAARFADQSNRSRIATMSATERAARDARALGDEGAALYRGGEFDSPDNRAFLDAFTSRVVDPAERASFSKDGRLTKEGADRMRSAVTANAYPDAGVLSRMFEHADDNVRNISNALADAAPQMAQLRAASGSGRVMPHLDQTGPLMDAVKEIAAMRSRGITPAQRFAQSDAFDRTDPAVRAWIEALHQPDGVRPLGRQQVGELLRNYAAEAAQHPPGGLFPDNTTALDVLAGARRRLLGDAAGAAPAGGGAGGAPPPIPPAGNMHPNAPGSGMGPPPQGTSPPPGGNGGGGGGLPPDFANMRNRARPAQLPSYMRGDPGAAARTVPNQADVIEAATRQRIAVPRAVASDSDIVKGIGGAAQHIPLAGSSLETAAVRMRDQLQQRVQDVANAFGNANSKTAGDAAAVAMREWIQEGSDTVSRRIYGRVRGMLDQNTTSPLRATNRLANRMEIEMNEARSGLYQTTLDLVDNALTRARNGEGMSYNGLVQLRSEIGARLSGAITPEPGTNMPALKRLYGALSEDLHRLVWDAGGARAVERYQAAERITQLIAERREALTSLIGSDGRKAGEGIAAAAVRLAADGSSANISKLLQIRKVVGPEAWDQIAGSAVRELGLASDNAFSAVKFLTDYNKLSPNGRSVLFGSTQEGSLRAALDDIATISSKAKDMQRFANPSGSGRVAALVAGLASFTAHPLIAVAQVAGAGVVSRMLAQPATARDLARFVQAAERAQSVRAAAVDRMTNGPRAAGPDLSTAERMVLVTARNLANTIASDTGQPADTLAGDLVSAVNAMRSGQ